MVRGLHLTKSYFKIVFDSTKVSFQNLPQRQWVEFTVCFDLCAVFFYFILVTHTFLLLPVWMPHPNL